MNSPLQRGFTLIEVIIFIVVVGAGLAGILAVSTNSVKASADPMVRKQAMALADSILEEIFLVLLLKGLRPSFEIFLTLIPIKPPTLELFFHAKNKAF